MIIILVAYLISFKEVCDAFWGCFDFGGVYDILEIVDKDVLKMTSHLLPSNLLQNYIDYYCIRNA